MLDSRLRTLLTVAETCSFTRTAERLKLSQPAVSHQINTLEKELGVRIFDRRKNGMILTSDGEIVLEYTYQLYDLNARLMQRLQDRQMDRKRVVIGTTSRFSNPTIDIALGRFKENHPDNPISFHVEPEQSLYLMLQNDELSFLLTDQPAEFGNFISREVATDPTLCVLPASDPLCAKRLLNAEDLLGRRLVLPVQQPNNRRYRETFLEKSGYSHGDFDIAVETDNYFTAMRLIINYNYIGILPKSFARGAEDAGLVITRPLRYLNHARKGLVVYRKDSPDMELIEEFIRLCDEMK